MVGFFLCEDGMYLCYGMIFIQMLINHLWIWTENHLNLWKTGPEALQNSSKVGGHWAICLLLSLGSFFLSQRSHCPVGDWKGTERGKKLSAEKIIQGKEAGKWHNGQGKEEGQRESVTLPAALKEKRETTGGTKELCGDPWSHFFQRIFCCQNKI